ncbi:MAG: hypothetical protein FWD03_03720, partial [Defluviitaleaceae bacterium]|nr:hypothetical protein [Defluviitaleaceae bacterium]
MNQTLTKKLNPILPFAALPLLLVALLMLLTDTTSAPYREVHSENGVWDLRDFDFENYNARLTGDVVYIPNALLTPEEFAARSGEVILGNTANINFLTSRVLILVPNDMWYSFTRDSILHSHRQYVNGLWIEEAQRGSPGHNRQSEIAGEGKITFTARPVRAVDDGYMIELVQQSSSFVHSRNDHHMGWLIGEGAGLIAESRAMDFQRGITMGFFFLLFLLFLMMYFMLQRNRAALYFSLFCLMWLLRMGTTGVWAFSVLMPWMDWSVKFRINYIAIPAAAILSLAIIDVLFPKTLHKIVLRINYIFSAVFIALYLFADTVFMSNALLVSYVIFGLTILYILVSFIFKVRNTQFGQKVFIIGMVFFLFATISDFFHFSFDFVIMPFEMTGIGMLIFALCMAAAVFVATMREVEKAKENENRLAAENAMLDHEKRFREDVMATVSHELRTPLTVMSVYAEMAVAEIKG